MIRNRLSFLAVSLYIAITSLCSRKKIHDKKITDYEYYSVILKHRTNATDPLMRKIPESIYHNARFHKKNETWEVFEKWETDVSLFVPNDPVNQIPGDWVPLHTIRDSENITKLNSIRNHIIHLPITIVVD
jgi:hypothetical protein